LPYPKNEAAFQRWKKALDHALLSNRVPWDAYDAQLSRVVEIYNDYLSRTPGFTRIDWGIPKALSWVECGAVNEQWQTNPMQIGVNGDPGLRQLLQTPSGKLVLPPSFRSTLTMSNAVADGNRNIEAGVGYLFWVFARFGYVEAKPVFVPSLSSVRTPSKSPVRASTPVAVVHKAPTQKVYAITGWKPFSLVTIAMHYNGGDGNYFEKLQYAYSIVNGTTAPEKGAAQTTTQGDHNGD
jgi:hypothetical protein